MASAIKLLEDVFSSSAVPFGTVHDFTLALRTNVLASTGRLLVVYTQ